MTEFDPSGAAAALHRARRATARTPIASLPEGLHPKTLAQGIAAQVALAGLQGAATPAGFKIGATARRMQDYLGLNGPAAAFMGGDGLHGSGSTLSFAGFLRPGVECELAVHLASDLPPGPCTPQQARAAVGEVMAAIEIVENRYQALAEFGAAAMVADQVFHAGAILGEPYVDWASLDLLGVAGRILVDDEVRGSGFGRDLLGDPMQALAWLAGSAEAAAFGGLRAGQIVMLGSVCPPVWLDRPGHVSVQFPPFATVSLTMVSSTSSAFN